MKTQAQVFQMFCIWKIGRKRNQRKDKYDSQVTRLEMLYASSPTHTFGAK
jgi:hypothetical protein